MIGPAVHDYCADGEDIHSEYTFIKDFVVKVKLLEDLKLPDTMKGLKRVDQPLANVILKWGRYVETMLKLLISIENCFEVSDKTLLDLWHVQVAQIQNLKEKHSVLLVQGQFNPDIARLYRALQKNMSGFTPKSRLAKKNEAMVG